MLVFDVIFCNLKIVSYNSHHISPEQAVCSGIQFFRQTTCDRGITKLAMLLLYTGHS